MFLSETGATDETFEALSRKQLGPKLTQIETLFASKCHGVALLPLAHTEFANMTVWNPFHKRIRVITANELDAISDEIRILTDRLALAAYEVKDSP